jgi:hypothetical protein
MQFYRRDDGQIFAVEDDGSQDAFIPTSARLLDRAEVEALMRPRDTEVPEAKAIRLRTEADDLDRKSAAAVRAIVLSQIGARPLPEPEIEAIKNELSSIETQVSALRAEAEQIAPRR